MQLRTRVGEGITGWVAQHGVAQYLPDAMADPRCSHVPGTEEDLAESLLVAPMLYEGETIGVILLAKLGARPLLCGRAALSRASTRRSPHRPWSTLTSRGACGRRSARSTGSCAARRSCCA